ncbi:RNA polymerase sigma-54 factor [uncultured Roseobacter sp.]|uniref:RNA polymerase factor sigma-54 n=1 Tax=uncultured Roseobacter sp. TaxID=114847 RepID=UPI002620390D|nr:RNA polymerase sigma-54 factor [uncultured Roseobacter sp.]
MNFSQTLRQSKRFTKSMIETVTIMRMTGADMHTFLSEVMERNPFIELENPGRGASGHIGHDGDGLLMDVAEVAERGIYQHVIKQLPYICANSKENDLALAFLQELELSGWLGASVQEIAAKSGFDLQDCENMLARLQTLEPTGLFARDLRECIRLQAAEGGQLDEIMRDIIIHLDALQRFDPDQLAKRIGCDRSDVLDRVQLIRRMDPKPGTRFDVQDAPSKTDDVVVSVVDCEVTVALNTSSFPTLRVLYPHMVEQRTGQNRDALRHLVQEARSLKKACALRNATTLSLITAIFIRQPEFLEAGFAALRPMRMRDVADEIGVSESTVSRILNGLTVRCSQGNVPARSLFCNAITFSSGAQTRHAALQKIKQWVATEDKRFPLKDEDIVDRFRQIGLSISRRTVSKYRSELGLIAPRLRCKAAADALRSVN